MMWQCLIRTQTSPSLDTYCEKHFMSKCTLSLWTTENSENLGGNTGVRRAIQWERTEEKEEQRQKWDQEMVPVLEKNK